MDEEINAKADKYVEFAPPEIKSQLKDAWLDGYNECANGVSSGILKAFSPIAPDDTSV